MNTILTETEAIYRASHLPTATIEALIGYARAVDWNATYALEHADDEPEKAAICLKMALAQLAVLCGAAPGTCI